MTRTNEQAREVSDAVLDTVQAFLETCPLLERADSCELSFGERMTGEQPTVRMMRMTLDGENFLIQCKRGG